MKIDIKLDGDFVNQFNKLVQNNPEKLKILNGFGKAQLDYTDFIDNFIDKQVVADASIDSNANVGHKDIVSLINEMHKPHSKLLGFNKIFYEIKKKWGYNRACDWLEKEWDGHFYMHDASSVSLVPYCYAYDLEELVDKGLYFISDFNHAAPKHLETYVDFVGEFVSYNCNRTSGELAAPIHTFTSYQKGSIYCC